LLLMTGQVVPLAVETDRVRAADLATVFPVWRELPGETPVLPAPIPGVRRELWRAEIDRLAVRHGLTPDGGGPERIRVERRMRPLDAVEAESALAASLAQRYRVPPDEVGVEWTGFRELLVPAGELRFRSTASLPPQGEAGTIPLSWVTPERRSATLWLRAKVEMRGSYAVAARALEARQDLVAGDVILEEGPLPRPPERWRLARSNLDEKILARSVAAGEKIPRAWLVTKPAVERGAIVELELRRGPIEIKARGRAEQAGSRGQRLVFRNLESGRRVTARVIDGKRAEVIP
jgi:flagella basal body P-ring formation protein FlgA